MVLEFFRKEPLKTGEQRERILPYDVRYALQYREANMGSEETLALVRNGFENEGLYVFLKAAQSNPDLQLSLMQDLVRDLAHLSTGDTSNVAGALKHLVEKRIGELPRDYQAPAMKLGQYSRQGFVYWRQKYAEKAQETAGRTNPTFLVGHSTLIGIARFIQSHAQVQKPLHVLLPHMIMDRASGTAGYEISAGLAKFLPKDFERHANAAVIDDVKQSGETERTLREFWTANGKYPAPQFEYLSITPPAESNSN